MEQKKIDWMLTTLLQWTLNIVLIALAVVLSVALVKETYQFFTYLFLSENASYYHLLEGILVFFLYFEFIALIIKYFQAHYHFPLRYFVYIGVTAIVRLIIVSHDNPHSVLLYAIAILVLVAALYIANTKMLKRE
ncbi:phosphate-starvation-inducible protein PsiE [Sporolactobacillus laevolacticus]|jgi:protein PsiE|uniref:Protein PsiE homolog n=1 Tax=Sporolactobacillus laevolacticus DSM 442 TaxID=1395513 RepID=V6IY72_9BACL|nr:phosphate-starvation-inducible protein PsiE [Sporolactobacillus laevolacticus]EST12352.1 phosphate-starvation-inducible protein PsiE [Sporolactobacillus laevolacticus DSM 442]MDF2909775.1 phosphate-starvation-inducible protein PsiE [Sporolactobacillus laevolacticus]MDN3955320.1 phosphate-starvation-inducible protein PsiE [Sporolactobacillus laevolacticus]